VVYTVATGEGVAEGDGSGVAEAGGEGVDGRLEESALAAGTVGAVVDAGDEQAPRVKSGSTSNAPSAKTCGQTSREESISNT
jgi:hypothetical protein